MDSELYQNEVEFIRVQATTEARTVFNSTPQPTVTFPNSEDCKPCLSSAPDYSSIPTDFMFVESRLGGKILLKDGHRYRLNKSNLHCSRWKCATKTCGSAITLNDKETKILRQTKHKCTPDFQRSQFEKVRDLCKQNVKNSNMSVTEVFRHTINTLDTSVDNIPNFAKMKNVLYNARSRSKNNSEKK